MRCCVRDPLAAACAASWPGAASIYRSSWPGATGLESPRGGGGRHRAQVGRTHRPSGRCVADTHPERCAERCAARARPERAVPSRRRARPRWWRRRSAWAAPTPAPSLRSRRPAWERVASAKKQSGGPCVFLSPFVAVSVAANVRPVNRPKFLYFSFQKTVVVSWRAHSGKERP